MSSEIATNKTPAPSAYATIRPVKSSLYFDKAHGFGEWRIVLNGRAIQDLREARRGDQYYFKCIIKKNEVCFDLSLC